MPHTERYPSNAPQLASKYLLESLTASMSTSELTTAEFGTLYYGCRREIKYVLFNDGPEAAPFMASVEVDVTPDEHDADEDGRRVNEGRIGNDRLPVEVSICISVCWQRFYAVGGVAEKSRGNFPHVRFKRRHFEIEKLILRPGFVFSIICYHPRIFALVALLAYVPPVSGFLLHNMSEGPG